jgi:N-methylhydantoinase A
MVAIGGAGPLHAAGIAEKVGISRIMCPANAGVGSALGLLAAAPRMHLVRSAPFELDQLTQANIAGLYQDMDSEAKAFLSSLDIQQSQFDRLPRLDMRFKGQAHALTVPVPMESIRQGDTSSFREAFLEKYQAIYGASLPSRPIEILNWRLEVRAQGLARTTLIDVLGDHRQAEVADSALPKYRQSYLPGGGGFEQVPVYVRETLPVGFGRSGPAVIEERGATIWIGEKWSFSVDALGNVVMTMK